MVDVRVHDDHVVASYENLPYLVAVFQTMEVVPVYRAPVVAYRVEAVEQFLSDDAECSAAADDLDGCYYTD